MATKLAAVKEVLSLTNSRAVNINERLASGEWVLLDFKIIEHWSLPDGSSCDSQRQLLKSHEVVYVIGRVK